MPDRAFDFEQDEIHRDREGRKEHADRQDARAIAKPHGVDGREAEPAFRGEHLADENAEKAEREAIRRLATSSGRMAGSTTWNMMLARLSRMTLALRT